MSRTISLVRELWCQIFHRRHWKRTGDFRDLHTSTKHYYRCERCGLMHDKRIEKPIWMWRSE